MSAKKSGLPKGRGLGSLLGTVQKEKLQLDKEINEYGQFKQIDIHLLQRGEYQPRGQISDDDVQELSASIKKHGVMQPIVIRPLAKEGDTKYEIIAGERRWRAAKLAGLTQIPAIVRELDDQVAIALALIENIQRQDLNPIEQALALQRFQDEFKMSHQEIADTVGKARATVSNLLRLLNLHKNVQALLIENKIEMGHARAILGLKINDQSQAATTVIAKQLTVRQTEEFVRDYYLEPVKTEKIALDVEHLTQRLMEHFNAQIKLDYNSKGKGKLTIHYHSLEELEGILATCGLALNDE